MFVKSNDPTTEMLTWSASSYRVRMAAGTACPHCGHAMHPSDPRRDPGALLIICGRCHKDVWQVEWLAAE
jgi:DNA-directed RNA polymerase subunit RPC12/RpoP